ncbi:hypothetical protein QBC39DRAFT_424885 [Podospora conica]|nr:hypothetical protein QBC39DRAFT_424885 [Schizothecium conicum]
MHLPTLLLLSLPTLTLSQTPPSPSEPRKVYLATPVNPKFVIEPKSLPAKAGVQLVVNPLANKPSQQWALLTVGNTTRIQLANTTLCIDAGAKANWKDMARVALGECDEKVDGQRWTVMADGRVAVEGSVKPQSCLDLEYMRATAGNPVGLYTCAGLGGTGAADKGIVWGLVDVTGAAGGGV